MHRGVFARSAENPDQATFAGKFGSFERSAKTHVFRGSERCEPFAVPDEEYDRAMHHQGGHLKFFLGR